MPAIILLSSIVVLVLAVVPLETVLQEANVLSVLAELVGTTCCALFA
jgi:ABC-type enterochelin transport system permease subunit